MLYCVRHRWNLVIPKPHKITSMPYDVRHTAVWAAPGAEGVKAIFKIFRDSKRVYFLLLKTFLQN